MMHASICSRPQDTGTPPVRGPITHALVLTVVLLAVRVCPAQSSLGPPPAKKLIEYGWDVPSAAYVAEHIKDMETRPFDGVIMRVAPVADVFATKTVNEQALQAEMEALKQIQWGRFTDNFLVLYARSEMDWFSDEDWEWVLRNVGLSARAARVGRCKGVVFDCEPYGKDPWDYKQQKQAASRSFGDYQEVLRKRGAQFLARVQEEFPDPVIHTFFLLGFYTHANRGSLACEPDPARREERLRDHQWALYPAFVAGMLEAAGPKTTITDGNEDAYWYAKASEFFESYHTIHQTAMNLIPTALHDKYRAHVQCGQAVYVDYLFGLGPHKATADLADDVKLKWFEHNVYYALKASDRYAWVYGENMDWWRRRDKLPNGIEDATRRASEKLARGEPLGFSR